MTQSDDFPPHRSAALARLAAFVPQAGRDYAALRNHDLPGHPHVSGLSPYIRHRLLLEDEVIAAVGAAHARPSADKFLAEVYWRSYWKGWLELRPGIWRGYRAGLAAALNRVQTESGLRAAVHAACRGDTGIDGFDHWARELLATGYLHNHARMWFASIWIFTLRLPWELGADFFLRHLLDGDAASNTLSWRWVGGLHTPGKTYLATPDNIARNTGGRFNPTGLATHADPLPMAPLPSPRPAPQPVVWNPNLPTALILHDDDLHPDHLAQAGLAPLATALLDSAAVRSPLAVGPLPQAFVAGALADVAARHAGWLGPVQSFGPEASADTLAAWALATGAQQVVTPHAPIGPVADRLTSLAPALTALGLPLVQVLRPFDAALWPHATHGFFRFREAVL
ncbi:DNA photolyase [Fertoebacter nigrum]|uniref:DNA photolyase n=1 Tax=Fertoeibacter niger TaxID=2656921 RepID=A0A8X8H526_9RHOB|nr:FAD-binding domain-containing protein [Fertoeibacter niger]NUB46562.1 DNA photolyase [Fertoeibacter niger]